MNQEPTDSHLHREVAESTANAKASHTSNLSAPLPWRWPEYLALFVLVLACLRLLAANNADPDLWGHVRYGQDVLRWGKLPATATYTYTAVDYPWINHEIICELVFACLVNAGGGTALILAKVSMGLTVVGMWLWRGRQTSIPTLYVVLLLSMVAMAPGWSPRPQAFSYLFWALQIVALDHLVANPRRTSWCIIMLGLPMLFALWINTHGGVVAGYCLLGAYLVGAVFDAWRQNQTWLPLARTSVLLILTCALACLLNPYGFELLKWLYHDLKPPRPEISEWASLKTSDPMFLPTLTLMALGVFTAIRSRQTFSLARVVVLVLTAWQSFAHMRHIPFFAIAAGFWLPPYVEEWFVNQRGARPTGLAHRGWPGLVVGLVGITAAMVLFALAIPNLRGMRVEHRDYPVAALQYMADQRVQGKLVVWFDWAQYVLATFGEQTPIAFDGRHRTCYPQEILDLYFDLHFWQTDVPRWRGPDSPPPDPRALLERNQPDYILWGNHPLPLKNSDGIVEWVLLYRDETARLYGRATVVDDVQSPRYIPPARRRINETSPQGWTWWPAFPQ